ncbi:MAG: acetyltransferase [Bacteroidota bacterium]
MNIYGASGHAKVIIEIVNSIGCPIDTVFDDDENITEVLNHPVLHSFPEAALNSGTVIAIGNNRIRKSVTDAFKGEIQEAIIHSDASVSESVKLGRGTVVMANASINAETVIGEHCILNTGSTVEHDCEIGDFVHISPNAAIAGGVQVGEGSHIGIGAVVIPGIKIGRWTIIGAGAVIIKNIPDFATVVGNPGKIIRYTEY